MGKKAVPASPPLAPCASPAELADDAAHGLMRRMPSLSAHRVVTTGQSVAFTLIAAAMIAAGILWPHGAWDLLVALTACAFVGGTLFRAALAFIGGLPRRGDVPAAGDLPLYTVLVPLYHEANVLPRLARALLLLDYPDMLAQAPQRGGISQFRPAWCLRGGAEMSAHDPQLPAPKPQSYADAVRELGLLLEREGTPDGVVGCSLRLLQSPEKCLRVMLQVGPALDALKAAELLQPTELFLRFVAAVRANDWKQVASLGHEISSLGGASAIRPEEPVE